MSDIWKNPLMWGSKSLEPGKTGDTASRGFSYDEIEVDSLDQIINTIRIQVGEQSSGGSEKTSAFDQSSFDTSDLRSVFADFPTGEIRFGPGVASSSELTAFDSFTALNAVTERGGAAERMGVTDGVAIEAGVGMGMPVKDAADMRDTLKLALSLLKVGDGNMTEDVLKNLQEKAKTGNLDSLLDAADQHGVNLPENISGADLYHMVIASLDRPENLQVALRNLTN